MRYADDETDLLRLLPPIRRARLWRLYAENGRRFLDLWSDCGRSILGAKGTGLGTAAKAAIDVGLTRPFPSVWEARFAKALLASYPGWTACRFYSSEEAALAALARIADGLSARVCAAPGTGARGLLAREAGLPSAGASGLLAREAGVPGAGAPSRGLLFDPARKGSSPNAFAVVLRPFAAELGPPACGFAAALPLLPCPAALAPSALLFRDEELARAAGGELLPPLALAAATRAFSELSRFSRDGYGEELWRKSDRRLGAAFERRGPWLFARVDEAGYGEFFRAALDSGLLLSPSWSLPSLIPGDFDDGELARIARRLD